MMWMAPELFTPGAAFDYAADVYSYGNICTAVHNLQRILYFLFLRCLLLCFRAVFYLSYLHTLLTAVGIVLWEICEQRIPYEEDFAEQPFFYEIQSLVSSGGRPRRTPSTPAALEAIMIRCWEADFRARPSFAEVVVALSLVNL